MIEITTKFEVSKVKKAIRGMGRLFDFYRPQKNQFGEITNEHVIVGTLNALYHESRSDLFITLNTSDSGEVETKSDIMLLCVCEDVASLGLQRGDFTTFNNIKIVVNEINDIQQWGLICDISLEAVV